MTCGKPPRILRNESPQSSVIQIVPSVMPTKKIFGSSGSLATTRGAALKCSGSPPAEPLPCIAAIFAPIKARVRALGPTPKRRRHCRRRGHEQLRSRWMERHRRHVSPVETGVAHAKMIAAITALIKPFSGGGDYDGGIVQALQ